MRDLSARATRRNGALASCEPCRKRKTRCDHQRPVCGSCVQRGVQLRCIYHPSPMTKKTAPNASNSDPSPTWSNVTTPGERTSPAPIAAQPFPLTEATFSSPAYSASLLHSENELHNSRVNALCRVLRQLCDEPSRQRLKTMVENYFQRSKATTSPKTLLIPAMHSIDIMMERVSYENQEADLVKLSNEIIALTGQPIEIDQLTTPQAFIEMFAGDVVRLEYLGDLFAIAAWSERLDLDDAEGRKAMLENMLWCSGTCLTICRAVTKLNDLLIWLGHTHYMLVATVKGHAYEESWQALGDLISDVIVFGMHDDKLIVKNVPFFIQQWRRKIFHSIYSKDKFLATVFDRPPRLLKRYSGVILPLDLPDEDILQNDEDVAKTRVTPEGWNLAGVRSGSSWVRVRSHIAEMLELVHEHRYRAVTDENLARLKKASERNWKTWGTIPGTLRYDPKCWVENSDSQECFMLTNVYLTFLHCDFLIWRTLSKHAPESQMQLLQTSSHILSLVQELGSFRRRGISFHVRFAHVMLWDGLSPAIALAQAAQTIARKGSAAVNLPAGLDRARLVRLLSVFVSELESITGPNEPNFDMCERAGVAISRTLDELLNAPPTITTPNTYAEPGPGPGPVAPIPDPGPMMLMPDFMTPDGLHGDVWEGLDMSTWAGMFDWTAMYEQDTPWAIS